MANYLIHRENTHHRFAILLAKSEIEFCQDNEIQISRELIIITNTFTRIQYWPMLEDGPKKGRLV